jgi:phosphatidylinositol-3-phosphatase
VRKRVVSLLVLAVVGFVLAVTTGGSAHGPGFCKHHVCSTGTTATTPPAPGACGTLVGGEPAVYQHVIWIVFENHSYSEIIGSSSAPYINRVASRCGLATAYKAVSHPSLPNYIAMTSGSTQGITDDGSPASHPLAAASIFSQTGTGGWTSLEESMPGNCNLTDANPYAVRHNPAAYYTNVRTDCASQDVPLGSTPDTGSRFTFVTPNLCNDMHDCSVSTGDTWLSTFLPKILSSSAYTNGGTAVFITWDEDDSSAGNSVPLLVVSPYTVPGTRVGAASGHYSLLRTTEDLLGLGCLGAACTAQSMRSAFGL